jgi:hypothetical protein
MGTTAEDVDQVIDSAEAIAQRPLQMKREVKWLLIAAQLSHKAQCFRLPLLLSRKKIESMWIREHIYSFMIK